MRLGALSLVLSGAAASCLTGCASCRDADIGSSNCVANGGGLGSGYKAPLAVLENAVWLPWKLVATPLTGMVQGGAGWYEETGEPVSATLTLPVGVAIGGIIGTVNGFGQAPQWIERDDNLFEAFLAPFITDQEIYKYTTPPHGRPLHAAHAPAAQLNGDADARALAAPYGWAESYNERLRHRGD